MYISELFETWFRCLIAEHICYIIKLLFLFHCKVVACRGYLSMKGQSSFTIIMGHRVLSIFICDVLAFSSHWH